MDMLPWRPRARGREGMLSNYPGFGLRQMVAQRFVGRGELEVTTHRFMTHGKDEGLHLCGGTRVFVQFRCAID